MAGADRGTGLLLSQHPVKQIGAFGRDHRAAAMNRWLAGLDGWLTTGPRGLSGCGQVLRQQRSEELAERHGIAGTFLLRDDNIPDAVIRECIEPMGVAIGIDQWGEEFRFEPGRFVLPIDLLQEADLPDGAGDFTQRCADPGCVMIQQWKKEYPPR